MDTTVEIFTLGGVRILRGGELVTGFTTRKAEALLIYIASTRRPQPREVLADLLWDERTQSQAMANLRVVLTNLRQVLGESITISRDEVSINPSAKVWLDAVELEDCLGALQKQGRLNAAAADQAAAALDLYRGEFLEGFSVFDCRRFEDWQVYERERLHRLTAEALHDLVDYEIERRAYKTGIAHAMRLLELDPLMETAHRQMMTLLASSGQRGEALVQYQTCRKILQEELGIEPAVATKSLYEKIRQDELAVTAAGAQVIQEPQAAAQIPFTDLPEGTVTFLSTDIEGSTLLLHRLREGYAAVLADQRRILREAFANWHGHEVETQGDAFFVAFSRATQAVCAAVEAQHKLAGYKWQEGVVVGVRMGIHTGEPWSAEEGYVGMDVHRAARIAHVGHGGQVLLSETTTALVQDELPPGVSLCDLGRHLLKDIHRPERISQLVIEGLPAEFPLLTSLEALAPEGRRPPRQVGKCPYRGLAAFQEADAPFYFGRETFVSSLEQAIRSKKLMAVIVGSSGSGKSSALLAGLLPRLRKSGGYQFVIFRPGSQPFYALAGAILPLLEPGLSKIDLLAETRKLAERFARGEVGLAQVVDRIRADSPETRQLLLVVDQFEELYTLCPEVKLQRAFIDELLAIVEAARTLRDASSAILLTLRADFMGQALAHRPFADALQEASLLMGPMTRQELRMAVEKPAEMQGAAFEPGLVERILDDVGEKPGNLPLLEFTLTQLWERQTDGWLTHADYDAMDCLEGALSAYADQVYADLDAHEQERAHRALVQLVQPGEGTEDTRRIATREELGDDSWSLIQRLADRRLVVTGRDASGHEIAEVVHEALILKWGRFQAWMDADRAFRLWEERLRGNLRQWQQSGQDEGALLHGAPLTEAEAWLKWRPQDLSEIESEYIQAGIGLRERQQMERERRRQRTVLALAAGLVLVAILGVIALFASQRASRSAQAALNEANTRATAEAVAVQERQNAQFASTLAVAQQATAQANAQARATAQVEAEAQRAEAEAQRNEARRQASIGLAAMALRELDTGGQDIGVLLALEALENYPYTWQAEQALGQAILKSRLRLILQHDGAIASVKWSPDGKRLLTASLDGTARVWDAATGEQLLRLDHEGQLKFAFWSPDGSQILTNLTEPDALIMWDGNTGERLFNIEGYTGWIAWNGAEWSPDGNHLAITNASGTAWIWDARTGKKLHTLSGHQEYIVTLRWSPSGDRLLTSSADRTAIVWDAQTGEPIYTLRGHKRYLWSGEWSPSGDRILTSSRDGTVKVWDAATGKERLTIIAFPDENDLRAAWSPSGGRILAGPMGGAGPKVFDAATGEEQFALYPGNPSIEMRLIAWSPAGDRILTALGDGSASIWDAASGEELFTLRGQRGEFLVGYSTAAWSPDSQRLATGTTDGTIMVWDVSPVPTLVGDQSPASALWSPAGDRVLSVSNHGARLWDPSSLTELLAIKTEKIFDSILYASWSPSGDRFALGLHNGKATIYEAATGAELLTITAPGSGGETIPTWSPDGSLIAVGVASDGSIRIWDAQGGAEKGLLYSYSSEGVWHGEAGNYINVLEWSPSGDKILSSAWSGIWRTNDPLRVWDVTTGKMLFSTKTTDVIAASWSPDGKRIATYSFQGTGDIWDAGTGENLLEFSGHTGQVTGLTWSPSGDRIASSGADGMVLVRDAHSGSEVLRYLIGAVVDSVDWSPDGSKLLVSYAGKIVILPVWNTAQELIDYAHACCAVRELSPEDRSLYGLPPADSD